MTFEAWNKGYLTVPEGQTPSDYLMELLNGKIQEPHRGRCIMPVNSNPQIKQLDPNTLPPKLRKLYEAARLKAKAKHLKEHLISLMEP